MNESSRHLFIVVTVALGTLLLLSMVPWGRTTGNRVKDFSLFSDLMPSEKGQVFESKRVIEDHELEMILSENTDDDIVPAEVTTEVAEEPPVIESFGVVPKEAPIVDGRVAIECYGTEMLPNLRRAIASGYARIAVVGDSYIEGDIFTQNLRHELQSVYGGSGVGYMGMHTDFPGFRKTVRQNDSGWDSHNLLNMKAADSLRLLNGEYFIGNDKSRSSYMGVSYLEGNEKWDKSVFVFLSPDSGSVCLTTSSGSRTFMVLPSSRPQILTVDEPTDKFTVKSDLKTLCGLGVYLGSKEGIQVDCMSIRGNSGIGHRRMNPVLTEAIRQEIDYDLIILEYGTNVLSTEQTDYSPYTSAMIKTIDRIRLCYPDTDILLLGIGDRGIKNGTEVISMPSCPAMVTAQREAARRSNIHFWDTRAAMGGNNSVVVWKNRRLVNSDYVHLNHAGGKELAHLFMESLKPELD